jgi:hypothetical protein
MATTFSTIADRRVRGTYDAALALRTPEAAAMSATTSTTRIAFACRKIEAFKVCFDIEAYTSYSAGTAEWTIAVDVSATVGGSSTVIGTILPAQLAGAAGQLEIVFGGDEIAAKLATAEAIGLVCTKTGSPGNLTLAAWIVPVQ